MVFGLFFGVFGFGFCGGELFFVFVCLFVEVEGKMISQQHGLLKERVEARAVSDVFSVCERSY